MIKVIIVTKKDTFLTTQRCVKRLALEHPTWIPVLDAATAVAERVEPHGGEFAGAWVVDELGHRGLPRWVPNLRILVTHGLLVKAGPSTRGGRRAYYRMPDRAGVRAALDALQGSDGGNRRSLRFVAAGISSASGITAARDTEDKDFEPRTWH